MFNIGPFLSIAEDTDDTPTPAPSTPPAPKLEDLSESDRAIQERITKLNAILGGATTINLHLQFLIRNNKADLMILKNIKEAVRNSVCHTATVMANSFMHSGTTSDQFLRDNLEWLSRATNWAKFTGDIVLLFCLLST